jgi:hypothetical protein
VVLNPTKIYLAEPNSSKVVGKTERTLMNPLFVRQVYPETIASNLDQRLSASAHRRPELVT